MKVLSTMTFNFPIQIIEFYAYYYNKLMRKGINNKTIPILVANQYSNQHNYNSVGREKYFNYIISSDNYKKYLLDEIIDEVLNPYVSSIQYYPSLVVSQRALVDNDYNCQFINKSPTLNMENSDYSTFKFIPRTHVTFEFFNNSIVERYKKVIYSYLYLHLMDYLDIYNINFQNNTLHFDIYFIIKGLEDVLKLIFKEINILISLFEDNNKELSINNLNIHNYIIDVTIDYNNGLKKIENCISIYNYYKEGAALNKLEIIGDKLSSKWGVPIEVDNVKSLKDFLVNYEKSIEEYTGYNLGAIKNDPYYNCAIGLKEEYSSIINRIITLKNILFVDSNNITNEAINMSLILLGLYKSEINDLEKFIKTVHGGDLKIFIEVSRKTQCVTKEKVILLLNDYTEDHFKLILPDIKGYKLTKPNVSIMSMKNRYKCYAKDKFKFAFDNDIKFSYSIEKSVDYSENKLDEILNIINSSNKFTKKIVDGIELLNINYKKLNTIDNIRLNTGIRDIILPEIYNSINKMNKLSDTDAFNKLIPSLQELIDNINIKIENEYNNTVKKDFDDIKGNINSIDKIFNNILGKNGDD